MKIAPETRYGIDVVPSSYVTSPHAVDAKPGENVPWWTPTWADVARHLGWRWIYFIPAGAALVGLLLLPLRPAYVQHVFWLWKPLLVIVFIPTAAAIQSIKAIVRNRKDPFCIHCGYTLLGLPDGHRCPECGRQFSLAVIEEYRRDPHWFVKRWKTMHAVPTADVPFDAGAVRRGKSRDGT